MTTESKSRMEEFFTWLNRGVMAVMVTLLGYMVNRFDSMERSIQDLASEKKVLIQRVNTVEQRANTVERDVIQLRGDLSDIFKYYELKPKR